MGERLNGAAKDLWSQIFARAAADPNAAMEDPNYDFRNNEASVRAAYAAAGWSDHEIDARLRQSTERRNQATITSPGVSKDAELFHAARCDEIEAEMARLGMSSHLNVARGIEPVVGVNAQKVGVIMTDQSIITAKSFTFRFCGVVAKAFVRTLNLNPWLWDSETYSEARAKTLFLKSFPLVRYWHQILFSFAVTGTNVAIPFKPASLNELILVEQIARAMELFMVGHEYGHHHLGHGRDIEADQHMEEYEADQFALRINRHIGETEHPIWNPYLAGGAGGIILLMALDIVRRYEVALGGTMPTANSHPPVADRIARFDSVSLLKPAEFVTLKGFRLASVRIMSLVDTVFSAKLADIPKDVLSKAIEMRAEVQGQR
jgi:hypothetical protein